MLLAQMQEALSEASKELITELRRSLSFLQLSLVQIPIKAFERGGAADFFSPINFNEKSSVAIGKFLLVVKKKHFRRKSISVL